MGEHAINQPPTSLIIHQLALLDEPGVEFLKGDFCITYTNIMAVNDDEENRPDVNEETALLQDHQSDHQSGQEPEEQVDEEGVEPKQPRKASWYIWRLLWVMFGALVLAVFIKGWIDAGSDVNVSF